MKSERAGLYMAVFLLSITLVMILASFQYAAETRIVPLSVGGVTFILLLAVFVNEIRPLAFLKKLDIDLTKKYRSDDLRMLAEKKVESQQLLVTVLWIVIFFLMIFMLGFHLSIPLYVVAFLKVQGKASWPRALITAGILWALVFLLFELAMEFSLYRGWLFGEVIPSF